MTLATRTPLTHSLARWALAETRVIPSSPELIEVAATARCQCGRVGLTPTTERVDGERREYLGCPGCYQVQPV